MCFSFPNVFSSNHKHDLYAAILILHRTQVRRRQQEASHRVTVCRHYVAYSFYRHALIDSSSEIPWKTFEGVADIALNGHDLEEIKNVTIATKKLATEHLVFRQMLEEKNS